MKLPACCLPFTFTLLCSLGAVGAAQAQDVSPIDIPAGLKAASLEPTQATFQGFVQYDFALNGVACKLVAPKQPAAGHPWVWRSRFWGHEPQFDRAMLERGWYVCYCDVGNLFGADSAIERWDRFYDLTQQLGLDSKPFLEGMSRGGLIIMRWATEHPDRVSGIYADNAVMDMRSWPGGKGKGKGSAGDWQRCLKAYGLNEAQAAYFDDGPLDRLAPLAAAGVPIIALINEADDVVPPAENGDRLVARYKQLSGPITEIRRAGLGHHPHSLKDPTVLVDFAIAAHSRGSQPEK